MAIAADQGLWRVPHWRRYWLARAASSLGTSVSLVVLPILVYTLSGSAALTGLLYALEALPYLVFGLFAGVIADRMDRRWLMVASDLANATVLASVAVAGVLGVLTVTHVMVAGLLSAFFFVWFDAGEFGALPTLVGRERLVAANSALSGTYSIATIGGPAVAGIAIAAFGPALAVGVDAISYALSAILLLLVPRAALTAHGTRGLRGMRTAGIRDDIREGLSFIRGHRLIRALTLLGAGLSVTAGGTIGLIVVYASEGFALAPTDARIPFFYVSLGLGALASAVILPRLVRRFAVERVTLAGLSLNAILLAAFALAPAVELALVLLGIWGATHMLVIINGISLRQRETPDHLQGRVNVTARMIAWGGTPFGALMGGLLAETLPIRVAYLLMCLPVLLAVIVGWWSPLGRPGQSVARS